MGFLERYEGFRTLSFYSIGFETPLLVSTWRFVGGLAGARFASVTLKGGAKKPVVVINLCRTSGSDVDWLVTDPVWKESDAHMHVLCMLCLHACMHV